MDSERPYRTGAPPRRVSLTGKLFPWNPAQDQPWYLHLGQTADLYLACFTEEDALRAAMQKVALAGYTIKLIQDGHEFQTSIPTKLGGVPLHLILDLYFTDNGRSRFVQIFRD